MRWLREMWGLNLVLGRPRRTEVISNSADCELGQALKSRGYRSTGAAEDGRAPTEEVSSVMGWWF